MDSTTQKTVKKLVRNWIKFVQKGCVENMDHKFWRTNIPGKISGFSKNRNENKKKYKH